jgi:hypothetical protein
LWRWCFYNYAVKERLDPPLAVCRQECVSSMK